MPMGTLRTGQDRSHHITRVSRMRGVRSSSTAARGIKTVHGLELCDRAFLASLLAQSRRTPTSWKTYISSQRLHFARVEGNPNLQSSICSFHGLGALLSLFFPSGGRSRPWLGFDACLEGSKRRAHSRPWCQLRCKVVVPGGGVAPASVQFGTCGLIPAI